MFEKEHIERGAAVEAILHLVPKVDDDGYCWVIRGDAAMAIDSIPAADVWPVVLCRDCINYVESEEANGEKMCVRDADWSVEDGCYYGFTEYPSPDWFCAGGKRGRKTDV